MDQLDHGMTRNFFFVLVNRIPDDPFKLETERSDKKNPYLHWIICAEYLSVYIHFMTNVPKSGIGINVTKDGSKIPYLMFVDDCLIFYKTNKTTVQIVAERWESGSHGPTKI